MLEDPEDSQKAEAVPVVHHKAQREAKALTAIADRISNSRFCRSCNCYRGPEGGEMVQIARSNNAYWRCQGCLSRKTAPIK